MTPVPATLNPALQMVLLDSLYGTERGLSASSELRGEISELITQLEAANSDDTPNEARPLPLAWHHQIRLSSLIREAAAARQRWSNRGNSTVGRAGHQEL
jgi:PAP_fibrillin